MKKAIKRFLSYVLCLCLCMTALSVHAEGETNATGITFTATLDKTSIYESGVDQTVVLTVNADQPVTLAAIGATVDWADALSLTAITNTDSRIDFTGNINLVNGKIDWYDANLATYSDVTNIAVATFTVPANTQAGNYEVSLTELILLDGNGDSFVNGVTVTATLEVKAAEEVTGYTPGISASENALEVDDSVNINITAGHASAEAFAAAEIMVGYDSSVLSFDADAFKTSYPNVSADTSISDTLKLVDHGESKSFGETGYVYTLPFKAVEAADNTDVTLSYAGFATRTEAETKDLTEAAYNPTSVTLNISEKSLSVTLPEDGILTGGTEVAYGDDYTFTLTDKDNYDYTITSVMMGSADVTASLVAHGDGTYTVPDVTGALVITATRTAKSYTVTIAGTGAADVKAGDGTAEAATTATYGLPYIFTTPLNSTEYIYETVVTIGENVYTNTTSVTGEENVTYTIPGEAITDDIVISVTKIELTANEVLVTIPSGVDMTGDAKATIGQAYTVTLTEEAGYEYSDVTATMEGSDSVTLKVGMDAAGNKTYTIENVTGAITFSVTKSVDTDGISVSEYVQLNGTIMWLVENTTAVADGKVPSYNGQNMFWSSRYGVDADSDSNNDGAYCYLVISGDSADTVLAAARTALGITTGSAASVAYDKDVNETGVMDASDAQLVWNMYSAQYSAFATDVTVAKFLEADVNGNKIVNMDDAAAVVAAALARTE